MPTSTFFNLPEQKRETLLAAARAEFARVPYAEASINQIIRAAGIPRGSFYMYFRDKDDLFAYLLLGYMQGVEELVLKLLAQHGGNPFTAFPAIYDYVLGTAQKPEWRATYKDLYQIATRNAPVLMNTLVKRTASALLSAATDCVDPVFLDLRGEGDLHICVMLFLSVTAEAIECGLASHDPAARRRLTDTLDILARGMACRSPIKKEQQ